MSLATILAALTILCGAFLFGAWVERTFGWKARELRRCDFARSRLRVEVSRLEAWLTRIDGGDNPCRDEAQLRQWAYEALTLGRPAPGGQP